MDEMKVRQNLAPLQANTKDTQPANDGFKTDIVDQSDKLKVVVTNGSNGEIQGKDVVSFARNQGEYNGAEHYD